MKKLNIGFMSSHGGSNMQAVIDAVEAGKLYANLCVLVSNNSNSTAITRAQDCGMPYYHLSQSTHPDADQLDSTIVEALKQHEVDYLLLVGYMKKLGPQTLNCYRGRIINIHPSLLPKYGGKGMYGRNVHGAVIGNKEKETGITIHLVDEEYDTGKIINQCKVAVHEVDTVDSLSQRLLKVEHEFLVDTLIKISNEEIAL